MFTSILVQVRKCRHCNIILTAENARPDHIKRGLNRCRKCHNLIAQEYRKREDVISKRKIESRRYYEANKEACLGRGKNIRIRRKLIVIKHYSENSMQCRKCGYSDMRALSIDHLHGSGNEHRKQMRDRNGLQFYEWLIVNNLPVGYQVLCMNCQFIKRHENNEFKRENK